MSGTFDYGLYLLRMVITGFIDYRISCENSRSARTHPYYFNIAEREVKTEREVKKVVRTMRLRG
jgi:hypothetical protein